MKMNGMRMIPLFIVLCFTEISTNAQELTDEKIERFSEYTGKCIGEGFKHFNGCYNIDAVIRGLKNYENDSEHGSEISEEDMQAILDIQEALFEKIAQENMQKAEAFLQELKATPMITTVNEKLMYKDLKLGTGEYVIDEDSSPLIHYKATTLDGAVLVNTFMDEKPVQILLKETIIGFVQGAIGLKQGGRRIIYIHPDLAYKKMGNIPPNSLLILEIEVVQIKPEN